MKRIHIVGRRNTGKTTLIVDLLYELTRRGFRVGTIKHTYHDHPLDVSGKDSFRHPEAGGTPAAFIAGEKSGVYLGFSLGDTLYICLEHFVADAI